ncbi:MAG: hypothetical protein RLZ95_293 [Bacteroidota bacterium]|jgi:hypothetical protein
MQDPKTILPASVLVSLYKDTLVLPESEKKAEKNQNKEELVSSTPSNIAPIELPKVKKSTGPLKHLGDHHKKILVIVNDPNSVYLNETDFILLTSILNACKLTIADIALVNIGNQETSLHQILETLPSTLIMCFDIASADLKIKLPNTLYKVNALGDTRLFFSKALSTMQGTGAEAKIEKGTLWILLKQLFGL